MSNTISYSIDGFEDLTRRITEMGVKGSRIENAALNDAAQPIYEDMRESAPVRTGRGRDSITIGSPKRTKGGKIISIGIHDAQRDTGLHMYYVEFGTSRADAHPFIRPAFERKKRESYDILKQRVKKGLGL